MSLKEKILTFLLVWLFFVSSSFLLFAQHVGFYFEKKQTKVTIPFEIHNNLIIIPIILNDAYNLKFILDTGVRSTILINREFADSLGLVYQRSIQLYGVGNEAPLDAYVTNDVSLSMTGIKSSGLSTLVLEKDFLHFDRHLGIRVHGIIGYDIFSRFVVKIDYARKRMTLFEPLNYKTHRKFHSINLEIIDSKPISNLNLQLNESNSLKTKLLIDTGASHALVLNLDSNEKIMLPEKRIQASLGRGIEGEINGHLARIDGLDFGRRRMKGIIASFPERSNYEHKGSAIRNGSIGGELLKRFTVVFDYLNSKMYVDENRSYKYPFEYNMSGLEFTAEGAYLDRIVISKIRENSAAHGVGFAPGDIIFSLNNVPSKNLDLTKIYTDLNFREGKKINLTVIRNGKYISKTFRLKREI